MTKLIIVCKIIFIYILFLLVGLVHILRLKAIGNGALKVPKALESAWL